MNRYRIAGAAAAAVAAIICFYSYFTVKNGGEIPYPLVFAAASVCFFAVGTAEFLISKNKKASGGLAYAKPVFFFIVAVAALAAAVWFLFK